MTHDSTWQQATLLSSLWEWFSELRPDERMQALTIDDPLWIRLYLKLFKHELKSRNKKPGRHLQQQHEQQEQQRGPSSLSAPCPSLVGTHSPPKQQQQHPPSCYTVKRDKINYMYGRLLKQQQQQHAAASAGNGSRALAAWGAAGDLDDLEENKGMEEDDDELDFALAAEEEEHSLIEGYRIPWSQQGDVRKRAGRKGERSNSDIDGNDMKREQGSQVTLMCADRLLQRSLRVCTLGATPLDTLTLSQPAVEDAEALYQLLRAVTDGAFLSKPLPTATAKQLSLQSSAVAAISGGGPGLSAAAVASVLSGGTGNTLNSSSPTLASHTGTTALPMVLPEAPWLQECMGEDKETIPLRYLLVSRLELSLWVAYWRRMNRCSVSGPRVPVGLKGVTEQIKHLQEFALKADPAQLAALFEGLRPAQHVLLQQQPLMMTGDKVVRCREGGEHSLDGSGSMRTAQLMMERLLLIPLHWVYQDEGKIVRRVLERIQTACADLVAQELLMEDEARSNMSTDTGSCNQAKKKKKKKQSQQQQRVKEQLRLEKQGVVPRTSLPKVGESTIDRGLGAVMSNGLRLEGTPDVDGHQMEEQLFANRRKIKGEDGVVDEEMRPFSGSSAFRIRRSTDSARKTTGLVTAVVKEDREDQDDLWEEVGRRGTVMKKPSLPPSFTSKTASAHMNSKSGDSSKQVTSKLSDTEVKDTFLQPCYAECGTGRAGGRDSTGPIEACRNVAGDNLVEEIHKVKKENGESADVSAPLRTDGAQAISTNAATILEAAGAASLVAAEDPSNSSHCPATKGCSSALSPSHTPTSPPCVPPRPLYLSSDQPAISDPTSIEPAPAFVHLMVDHAAPTDADPTPSVPSIKVCPNRVSDVTEDEKGKEMQLADRIGTEGKADAGPVDCQENAPPVDADGQTSAGVVEKARAKKKTHNRREYKQRRQMRDAISSILTGLLDKVDQIVSAGQEEMQGDHPAFRKDAFSMSDDTLHQGPLKPKYYRDGQRVDKASMNKATSRAQYAASGIKAQGIQKVPAPKSVQRQRPDQEQEYIDVHQVHCKPLASYVHQQPNGRLKYKAYDHMKGAPCCGSASLPRMCNSQHAQHFSVHGNGRAWGSQGCGGDAGVHMFPSSRLPLYPRIHQYHHNPQYYQEYPRARRGGVELCATSMGANGGQRGQLNDGSDGWKECNDHRVIFQYPLLQQTPVQGLHNQYRHHRQHLQAQRRLKSKTERSDGYGTTTGDFESVVPPPLVLQQPHELYALDMEAEQARLAYNQGIDAMRSQLSENIADFMKNRETKMMEHRAARERILEEVRSIIQSLWAGSRVELYGSCFTGLDLISSDLDLVVCGLKPAGTASPALSALSIKTPQMSRQQDRKQGGTTSSSSPEGTCSISTTTSGKSCISSSSTTSTTTSNSTGCTTGQSSAASSVAGEEEEETDNHSHSQLSDTSSNNTTARTATGSRSPALSSPASSPRFGPAVSSTTSAITSSTTPPRSLPPGHSESARLLYQLAGALEGRAWIRSIKTIDTAFVPVIKILADPAALSTGQESLAPGSATTLVPVDISLEGPQHGGIASSLLIRDLVGPGKPYAHAVPLTLVLKALLMQRGLNQPWCGGISSYALMLMVITVLQQFERPEEAQANVMAIARSVDCIKRRVLQSHSSSDEKNCGTRTSIRGENCVDHSISSKEGKRSQRDDASSNTDANGTMDYGKAVRGALHSLEDEVHKGEEYFEVRPPPPLVTGGYGSPAEVSYRLWSQFAAAQTSEGRMAEGHEAGKQESNSHVHRLPAGFLLTYFLEYYGRIFNPQAEGIAVDQGYGLTFPLGEFCAARGLPVVADPLTILDPLDRAVNVSRCAFRIGEIQYLFQQCLTALETQGMEMARAMLHKPAVEDDWSHVGSGGGVGKRKKSKKGTNGQRQPTNSTSSVPTPKNDVLSLILGY